MKDDKNDDKKPIPRSNTSFFQPMPDPERHHHRHRSGSVTTTVNVTVNEKQEGEVSGCFKALFSCAKKAK